MLICRECRQKLHYICEPACKKCGKSLEHDETEYCGDCRRRTHRYTRGRAVFPYDRLLRASIARFKYKGRREYADFYAEEMAEQYEDLLRSWNPDALVPIPLHKTRKRKRGFNQAQLLAEKLGKRLEIPVEKRILERTKKTGPQKELNDVQRRANLKNAFQVRQNDVRLKRIVLVDDIYTTGSTIDAAAAVLLEHGAEKVYFLTICIGRGF